MSEESPERMEDPEELAGDASEDSFEEPDTAEPPPVVGDGTEEEDSVLAFPIVGIGGSAGGVEAYIELFQHLAPDLGMAYVVIPHLHADQTSYLPEIISRTTAMPTRSIEDGLRPEPNHVYVLMVWTPPGG
ncbi:MAG TPA: chemotaxis protein CheB [Bryobacteraceae bacterium]|jgi:two-component system CheB/CheR fusion protein|nr:chemotaxis protein CheB [Bryobacteraceae bacterium]